MLAALPPSSSVSFFFVPATAWVSILPTAVEPVNAILSTSSMFDQRFAGFARAGDDIDDAIGQFGFLQNLGQMHRSDAGRLGRLQHTSVSARERRREFPRRH